MNFHRKSVTLEIEGITNKLEILREIRARTNCTLKEALSAYDNDDARYNPIRTFIVNFDPITMNYKQLNDMNFIMSDDELRDWYMDNEFTIKRFCETIRRTIRTLENTPYIEYE